MKMKKAVVLLLAIGLLLALAGCGGSDDTKVMRFETIPVALAELSNGGLDAVVADRPVVLAYLENNPQAKVVAFGDDKFDTEFYGMAMRQSDEELHQLVNEGLQKVKEMGLYDKINNKYFGNGEDFEMPENDNSLGKKYIVAMDAAYAPFEYIDEATGEIVGFDAELTKAIGAVMGFEVELMNYQFDGLIAALAGGNIDIIASAMTITEERKKAVTFSEPYFEATQYIVVNEGSDIEDLDQLEGKKIGVQNSTTGDIFISDYFGK